MSEPTTHQGPSATPPQESGRQVCGQFLKFIGLVASAGGSLALIRLLGTREEGSPFYALFMPVGLVIWLVGFLMCSTPRKMEQDAR